MDVDYFLRRRVDAIAQFYEEASSRFVETMGKIEREEPPFEPIYAEDGEPQFLEEWLQQSYSLELIGRSAISNLSNTLKIYFETWSNFLWEKPQSCREAAPELFRRSFVRGYLTCFSEITGLDLANCPADIDVIEQVILARNLDGHAGSLTSEAILHNKTTLIDFRSLCLLTPTTCIGSVRTTETIPSDLVVQPYTYPPTVSAMQLNRFARYQIGLKNLCRDLDTGAEELSQVTNYRREFAIDLPRRLATTVSRIQF